MPDKGSLRMSLGKEGKQLIQEFERFRSRLYHTDGGGHCTIGWGHLVHRGKCDGRENEKVFLKGINKKIANEHFGSDVRAAEDAVNQRVGALGVTVTQNQFDALVSFTYNTGTGSLANVLRSCTGKDGKLNLQRVPDHMKAYVKSNGKVSLGLTNRRNREVGLFNKPQVQQTKAFVR